MRKARIFSVAMLVVSGFLTDGVLGANLTWTGGPDATWDTTSNNWSGAGTQATPWDSGYGMTNFAYFTTEGASPSVSGTVYLRDVRFSNTTTVAGSGTINFQYLSPNQNNIVAISNVTFNANYYRNAGGTLAISGPGKITFNGVNYNGGQFSLNSGEMVISATGAHTNANITSIAAAATMRVYGLLRMNGESTATANIQGQFVQEDGTVTSASVNGPFSIYSGGSYSLNNGSLSVASIAKVGTSSAGTFTQSGGTNTLSKDLYLA